MGFLDFLKKPSKELILSSPFEGTVVPLENVPDPAFAEKMIGDGIAIMPSAIDTISAYNITDKAQFDVFKTGHAYTYEYGKVEIIVHIGIETVKLKGEGFTVLVKGENTYPLNTEVIKIDRKLIESKGLSLISPIVIATMELVESIEILVANGKQVVVGQPLLKILLK